MTRAPAATYRVAGHMYSPLIPLEPCMRKSRRIYIILILLKITNTNRRWGFNRLGQLGLGLKCSVQNFDFQDERRSNKCNSDMLLKPVPVSLFPGRVKLIETAANSSAALRDEDGMLFCWGSGESARLGHGPVQAEENESMEIAPVEYPRAVQGMRGRVISSIALTEDGGFAFVPSSVSLVEPPLLPISGGAKLILRGGGILGFERLCCEIYSCEKRWVLWCGHALESATVLCRKIYSTGSRIC